MIFTLEKFSGAVTAYGEQPGVMLPVELEGCRNLKGDLHYVNFTMERYEME